MSLSRARFLSSCGNSGLVGSTAAQTDWSCRWGWQRRFKEERKRQEEEGRGEENEQKWICRLAPWTSAFVPLLSSPLPFHMLVLSSPLLFLSFPWSATAQSLLVDGFPVCSAPHQLHSSSSSFYWCIHTSSSCCRVFSAAFPTVSDTLLHHFHTASLQVWQQIFWINYIYNCYDKFIVSSSPHLLYTFFIIIKASGLFQHLKSLV